MDCPSDSRALATHHLDVSDALHVLRESPGDKRTSWFVSCLKLLPLTVWAGRVTINTLPEEILLLIFHFDCIDRVKFVDRVRHLSWNDLRWTSLVCVCRRVAVGHFCVAKLSRPETCLRSYYTRGAHGYLATHSNHYKGLGRFVHA
jgi:hypothetical protein